MAETPGELAFIWAEAVQESGGNYRAVNGSSGALGKWQIMPGNLPGWAAQCGMPQASPAYFLSHPAYQNRMVQCQLGRAYRAYGARGAAAVWYSGQPNPYATYGNPPVYVYVNSVIAIMHRWHGQSPYVGGLGDTGGGGGTPAPGHNINPPKEDYSPVILASVTHVRAAGGTLAELAIVLHRLRG